MEVVLQINGFMELTEENAMMIDGGNLKAAAEDYLTGLGGVALGTGVIGSSLKQSSILKKVGGVAGGIGGVAFGIYMMGHSVIDLFK
ncbi:hypothetical protein BVF91_04120 [Thermoanaerobacterium sp. PSU-2]|uniref:hypothetical protein n=1 Tax=Thermoanaerobacterium sp. PSU-2 TaxID=1930849 RepID=UPI000A1628FF|nr:hypothetical protein [Thermoanaerobacterium sp. PSU-2]ORX24086.1 hypothetical protein BVF91_04120 [Thermoanaerobacterium sp. PSU-2]